jgi:hypothetical protein
MKRPALMLLMAAVAFAGELTRKWSGTLAAVAPDGSTHPAAVYADFELIGQIATGTAGPGESDQREISNGKLDGSKLTFDVPEGPGGVPLKFDLVFDGEAIKGTASAEKDGQRLRANLDLKRKQ